MILIFARVHTSVCRPESSWSEVGSKAAIKKFDMSQFYDKVDQYKFFTEVEKAEECGKLCRKAFEKECEMFSRLVYKHKHHIYFFLFFLFFWGIFSFSFVLYSALLHLAPLRFHCAYGCWDQTQDRCNWCIGSQTL
jgi:hypothetical protein